MSDQPRRGHIPLDQVPRYHLLKTEALRYDELSKYYGRQKDYELQIWAHEMAETTRHNMMLLRVEVDE